MVLVGDERKNEQQETRLRTRVEKPNLRKKVSNRDSRARHLGQRRTATQLDNEILDIKWRHSLKNLKFLEGIMKAKTTADRDATAVGTKTAVAPAVGAGAGASAAETEMAETATITTSITAKSFIIFNASMKLLWDSSVDENVERSEENCESRE
ncbi:hypothetical protein LXL04_004235 [Taraxacum kok-saghyz]